MRSRFIACCLLAMASLGDARNKKKEEGNKIGWNSVKVKYNRYWLGPDGLYNIPLTISSIKTNEFQFLENHKEFPSAKLYCYPKDPRVCPMYDSRGNIAGLRVAYIKADLKNRKGELPYSYKKPIFGEGTAFGKDFYYIDVLFISPESLAAGGPTSRAEAVGTGVYLRIEQGKWSQMPRKESDTKNTLFTKQACFPGMGMHYFYKMNTALDCHDHQPPFLLYDSGELIGIGLVSFGTFTGTDRRTWFEDPPGSVIKSIAPWSPQCIRDWVDMYGATSLHIFFKECPRFTCVPVLGKVLSRW